MNWDTIVDGLYVSALGMGMVSAVLVLLAVTVRAVSSGDSWLEKRGGLRIGAADPETEMDTGSAGTDAVMADAAGDTEQIAAVAVAIALALEAQQTAETRASMHPASGRQLGASDDWLAQGKARQLGRQTATASRGWSRR